MSSLSDEFRRVVRDARARRGVALMGVCNVTPDSFSDGGRYLSESDAKARIDALLAEGADILDIGGESTRPGSEPVSASEQIRRIEGTVRYAAAKACVSVDTTHPEVAEACLRLGAHAVNDVSCVADAALAEVVARADAAFVVMHSRGAASTKATYGDIVRDVTVDWTAARDRALLRGVPLESLFMDPGLGFSKTASESAELLRRLDEVISTVGVPVLVGASRKSFLSLWTGSTPARERLGASIAAALAAAAKGASIVRVHDVRETREAMDCARALRARPEAALSRAEVGHA